MANGYALGQLSNAFLTATTHEDAETRRRADRRAQQWIQALAGMAGGQIQVGSRTPVLGLPAWVSLEVLRGGFPTGKAVAERAMEPDEVALARRLDLKPLRGLLFGYFLTDGGLQELNGLLDSGTYRVQIPEDAVLLIVAWLLRAGDRDSALGLLEAVSPLAHRLRFTPRVTSAPTTPSDHVFRLAAGQARAVLSGRRQNDSVETQREALTVWNPFADRVLELWLERFDGGQLSEEMSEAWRTEASALLADYQRLSETHTRCTKHRKPKENLAILLAGVREAVEHGSLGSRRRGLGPRVGNP
jgi:hypothetical protein